MREASIWIWNAWDFGFLNIAGSTQLYKSYSYFLESSKQRSQLTMIAKFRPLNLFSCKIIVFLKMCIPRENASQVSNVTQGQFFFFFFVGHLSTVTQMSPPIAPIHHTCRCIWKNLDIFVNIQIEHEHFIYCVIWFKLTCRITIFVWHTCIIFKKYPFFSAFGNSWSFPECGSGTVGLVLRSAGLPEALWRMSDAVSDCKYCKCNALKI